MKQLVHILRKDIRHFYPEILLNLVLFTTFGWVAPKLWPAGSAPTIEHLIEGLLRVLLPLGWLVLIVRVVHDEPLVGDRQFWLTRPYSRFVLLAEKLTFLLLFLHLPLLLMQSYLLYRAGLPVSSALAGLLQLQLGVFLVIVLPLLSVSTVTANFGQNLLWVLGAIVYLLVVLMSAGWATRRQMTGPGMHWVLLVVLETGLAAVVLWMYGRRSVLRSRVMLIGLPLLLVLLYVSAPTQWLVHRAYVASAASGELVFNAAQEREQPVSGKPLLEDGDVAVDLPVRMQGVNENDESIVQGARITLRSASGETWTSGYEKAAAWLRGGDTQPMRMTLPLEVYQRMQGGPVTLTVEAETARYVFGPARNVTVPADGSFDVPSGGKCKPDLVEGFLRCRYALYSAPALLVSFEAQREPCEISGQHMTLHQRTNGSTPASFNGDLDPVALRDVPLSKSLPSGDGNQSADQQVNLCPGAHVSLQEQQLVSRQQLTLTTPPIHLNSYVPHEHSLAGMAH